MKIFAPKINYFDFRTTRYYGVISSRRFAVRIGVVILWVFGSLLCGSLVGLLAVIAPPIYAFGFVGFLGLFVLWSLPNLEKRPDTLIRRMFYCAFIINIVIPVYYSYNGFSPRRLINFPLQLLFLVVIATSVSARRYLRELFANNPMISILLFGYIFAALLSVPTSISPFGSMSAILQTAIEIYLPFLVAAYSLSKEEYVGKTIIIVIFAASVLAIIGVADFLGKKSVMPMLMPAFVMDSMIATYPQIQKIITGMLRRDEFRATASFNNSLSFAEFEALASVFCLMFILNGRKVFERVFGVISLCLCFIGIFTSSSRGGYLYALVACASLIFAHIIRLYKQDRRSLVPALFAIIGFSGVVVVVAAILFVPAVNLRVMGGGAETYSNLGREIQWSIGIPQIESRPLTGRGFGQSGDIIAYHSPGTDFYSVDSYLLAVLVETGLLGAITYFGMLVVAIWVSFKMYISNITWRGVLMGGLGSTLLGFLTYRINLNQRENFVVVYTMIACVMALNFINIKSEKSREVGEKPFQREP